MIQGLQAASEKGQRARSTLDSQFYKQISTLIDAAAKGTQTTVQIAKEVNKHIENRYWDLDGDRDGITKNFKCRL